MMGGITVCDGKQQTYGSQRKPNGMRFLDRLG
jgi:hypothetical protein